MPQRPPGPAKLPHAPTSDPGGFPSHPGRQCWRGCGLPTCLIGDGRGYAPSPKVSTSISFQVQDGREEGGARFLLAGHSGGPEGDRDLGPGWRAPGRWGGWGWKGSRQAGSGCVLTSRPPGAREGLENLPILQPSRPPPYPPPAPAHTLTHTSEARLGVGRPGDQRLSLPHHFLLNVSKINRTSKGNSPNSPGGWLEGRAGGGCQPLGDFSLGGGQICALELPFGNCPPPSRGTKFAQSWPPVARTVRAEDSEGYLGSA